MSAESPLTATAFPRALARRHSIIGLTFAACFIAYTDRVNIAVAAVAMKEQLGWTQTQKGLVLSSFFIGYMLFMFVSGLLAKRFGGKRVLGLAVLIWSLFTLLTPPMAALSLGALIAARIGMGMGEAAMFPAAVELYSRWVPVTERTRAMARLLSGIPLGTLVGLIVTGWIVGRYAWSMAFYSFGVLGLLWVAVWFWWAANDPATDPRISPDERSLLASLRTPSAKAAPTPWKKLLTHGPLWAMVMAHFATTWSLYVLLSWLPSYFREVQGLSIASAGLFSAAPWLAMFLVTNVSASISDRMVQRGVSLTRVRKIIQCTGLLGPAIFLLALRGVHSPSLALLLLCCATGALGCTWSGYAPNPLDMAPRFAGVITGFSNTFATIPGIVGVALTGWLVDFTGTYAAAFMLTAAISATGAVVYGLFFDARPIED